MATSLRLPHICVKRYEMVPALSTCNPTHGEYQVSQQVMRYNIAQTKLYSMHKNTPALYPDFQGQHAKCNWHYCMSKPCSLCSHVTAAADDLQRGTSLCYWLLAGLSLFGRSLRCHSDSPLLGQRLGPPFPLFLESAHNHLVVLTSLFPLLQ